MAKKKATSYQPSKNSTKAQNNSLVTFIAVFVSVVIVGGSLIAIAVGGNSGGGSAVNGGQSTSSLESQIKTLTEQVYASPKDFTLQESLGTAYFSLANGYKQANDPRAAETFVRTIQVYNEALKLKPDSKETLGDLATAYFYSGQVDQAIVTVEKALKIDPTFAPALMNYGIYLADGKGDYLNAIKQLEKVPAGTPQYSQAQSTISQYKQSLTSPQNQATPLN